MDSNCLTIDMYASTNFPIKRYTIYRLVFHVSNVQSEGSHFKSNGNVRIGVDSVFELLLGRPRSRGEITDKLPNEATKHDVHQW